MPRQNSSGRLVGMPRQNSSGRLVGMGAAYAPPELIRSAVGHGGSACPARSNKQERVRRSAMTATKIQHVRWETGIITSDDGSRLFGQMEFGRFTHMLFFLSNKDYDKRIFFLFHLISIFLHTQ